MGAGVEAENTVMGMAINLAARMESSAPPGCLLISHDTYRQVRGLFDVQAQPPLLVKGKDEHLRTYLVLPDTAQPADLASRGRGCANPPGGSGRRARDPAAGFSRGDQTRQAQLVTIVGEPGIGKTRLTAEFERWVDSSRSAPAGFMPPPLKYVRNALRSAARPFRFALLDPGER